MNHTENLIRSLKVEIRNKSWKTRRLKTQFKIKGDFIEGWPPYTCTHTHTQAQAHTHHFLFLQFLMLGQAKPDLVHNPP